MTDLTTQLRHNDVSRGACVSTFIPAGIHGDVLDLLEFRMDQTVCEPSGPTQDPRYTDASLPELEAQAGMIR
jgi:hypothetical protein